MQAIPKPLSRAYLLFSVRSNEASPCAGGVEFFLGEWAFISGDYKAAGLHGRFGVLFVQHFGDAFCGGSGEPTRACNGVKCCQIRDWLECDFGKPFGDAGCGVIWVGFGAAGGVGEPPVMGGRTDNKNVSFKGFGRIKSCTNLRLDAAVVEPSLNGFGDIFGVSEVCFVNNECFH